MRERMIVQRQYCKKCQDYMQCILLRTVASNRNSMLFWECLAGKHRAGDWVPHSYLDSWDVPLEMIPIHGESPQPFCERCGTRGAEYHHWAPQVLFEDADEWPTSYLCKRCHSLWHDTVTPDYQMLKDRLRSGNGSDSDDEKTKTAVHFSGRP